MKKIILNLSRFIESYIPDAFIFCLLLTLLVFGASLILTPFKAAELVGFWGKDFWNLNSFAMQMIFVLVTGQVIASSNLVRFLLGKITSFFKNPQMILVLVSLISLLTCWLNWGLGLMISAILAVEFGKRVKGLNFSLLIATAYSGFIVWHGGLSGSIPLKVAGQDEILTKWYPGLSISLQDSVFSNFNLGILFSHLLAFPFTAFLLGKLSSKSNAVMSIDNFEEEIPSYELRYFSFEKGPILIFMIGILFLIRLIGDDSNFDINKMNFLFLTIAFLLYQSPMTFLNQFKNSFSESSAIALQFPFYAGLMGLMQSSGLIELLSNALISFSDVSSLPLFGFLSAGLVNIFVPSGGGQWVVQGPVLLEATKALGADPIKVCMAISWGDAWTNLIQPFWAIPILGLAGLKLKDILGHCLVYFLVSGLILLTFFSWF